LATQDERRESFRAYLRDLLRERRVSMRALSLAVTGGADPAYFQQVVGSGRRRATPTPDQCRVIAQVLSVPFAVVLQQAWGIDPEEIAQDVRALGTRREAILQLSELTDPEFEDVKNFVEWTRAKRRAPTVSDSG
jgi:hypothetical protein